MADDQHIQVVCHLTLCHCTPEELSGLVEGILRRELETTDVERLAAKLMMELNIHLKYIAPLEEPEEEE